MTATEAASTEAQTSCTSRPPAAGTVGGLTKWALGAGFAIGYFFADLAGVSLPLSSSAGAEMSVMVGATRPAGGVSGTNAAAASDPNAT